MCKFSLVYLLFIPILAYGQDTTDSQKDTVGTNRIFVSFAGQNYINSKNLIATNMSPNPIRPKNTIGFSTGISFERITRYGLIFSAGLRYEQRSHDIDVVYDMTNHDTLAINNLRGVVVQENVNLKLAYLSPAVSIGYRYMITKKCGVTLKGGIAMKYLLNEKEKVRHPVYGYLHSLNNLSHTYLTDDYSERIWDVMTVYSFPFEHQKYAAYSDMYKKYIINYQYYLGFEQTINRGLIQDISVGMEITRATSQTSTNYYEDAMLATDQKTGYTYYYYDRNISIGLRLAVGLWP